VSNTIKYKKIIISDKLKNVSCALFKTQSSFHVYEVFDVLSLTKHPYFAAHDAESLNMVLDTAEGFAAKAMRPYLKESDQHPPQLVDGNVKVHPAVHDYYRLFSESGLLAAGVDEQYGGQQLPKTICAATDFIMAMHTTALKCSPRYRSEQQDCSSVLRRPYW
jgi:butyryl-CoA dehydrogenase